MVKKSLEKFSSVSVAPKIRHFHFLGCPAYVLDNALQYSQKLHKWSSRSSLGVYLGASPNHAKSVASILNLRTGHVSAQFHIKFDDFFSKKSRLSRLCLINLIKHGSILLVLQSARRRRNKGKLPVLLIILKGVFLALLLPHCPMSNPRTFHRLWKA